MGISGNEFYSLSILKFSFQLRELLEWLHRRATYYRCSFLEQQTFRKHYSPCQRAVPLPAVINQGWLTRDRLVWVETDKGRRLKGRDELMASTFLLKNLNWMRTIESELLEADELRSIEKLSDRVLFLIEYFRWNLHLSLMLLAI